MFRKDQLIQYLVKRLPENAQAIETAIKELNIEDSLDLIDTEQLIQAFERRCELFWMVMRPAAKDPSDNYDYRVIYHPEEKYYEATGQAFVSLIAGVKTK